MRRSTERTLLQTLGHFGIRKIEALGAPFDPSLHEAVMEIDDPEREPGTVAEVVQDGYLLHDRLLRPARVVVVKRRADASAQDDRPGLGALYQQHHSCKECCADGRHAFS